MKFAALLSGILLLAGVSAAPAQNPQSTGGALALLAAFSPASSPIVCRRRRSTAANEKRAVSSKGA